MTIVPPDILVSFLISLSASAILEAIKEKKLKVDHETILSLEKVKAENNLNVAIETQINNSLTKSYRALKNENEEAIWRLFGNREFNLRIQKWIFLTDKYEKNTIYKELNEIAQKSLGSQDGTEFIESITTTFSNTVHKNPSLSNFFLRSDNQQILDAVQSNSKYLESQFNELSHKIDVLCKDLSVFNHTNDQTYSSNAKINSNICRLPITDEYLFGRETKLNELNSYLKNSSTHIAVIVADGGMGKTSLVNHWILQKDNLINCKYKNIYAWSFYTQGTGGRSNISGNEFLVDALGWFGDPDPDHGSSMAKGRRLANIVRTERSLIILDGLEPLQQATGENQGIIIDHGVKYFLKELAFQNEGLCVITTRADISDLKSFINSTVKCLKLEPLSKGSVRKLFIAHGTTEIQAAQLDQIVILFHGHPLAIKLLAKMLAVRFDGHINKRKFIEKIIEEPHEGGHAVRVMKSYDKWLKNSLEWIIIHIMGLFDRPVQEDTLTTVRNTLRRLKWTNEISNNEILKWEYALKRLVKLGLISEQHILNRKEYDCHPIIREFYREKLEMFYPRIWKKTNNILFELFQNQCVKLTPDSFKDMEPLFLAVTHGCSAGLHNEALQKVYWLRIRREYDAYSVQTLGAFGADLSAVSNFFITRFSKIHNSIAGIWKARVFSSAGLNLRAQGQLQDSVIPMTEGLNAYVQNFDWKNASIDAAHLAQVHTRLGHLQYAIKLARKSQTYINKTEDTYWKIAMMTCPGEILYLMGNLKHSEKQFILAESLQKKHEPDFPYLYGLQGFLYCLVLIDLGKYDNVTERATIIPTWETRRRRPLDIANYKLILGIAYLFSEKSSVVYAQEQLNISIDLMREAGRTDYLPIALLARVLSLAIQKKFYEAWQEMDTTKQLLEDGEMKLFMINYHVVACRLLCEEIIHKSNDNNNDDKDEIAGLLDRYSEHIEEADELRRKVGAYRLEKIIKKLKNLQLAQISIEHSLAGIAEQIVQPDPRARAFF